VIIEKAGEWGADLIVVGSHGRKALGQFFFGSVSQKVLHEAHCSVRVARGRIEEPDTPVRLIKSCVFFSAEILSVIMRGHDHV
jgi:Universal stress protein family